MPGPQKTGRGSRQGLAARKKNPGTKPGLEAFFAVTHQGPAQGGKAGGGEPPEAESNKNVRQMQAKGAH